MKTICFSYVKDTKRGETVPIKNLLDSENRVFTISERKVITMKDCKAKYKTILLDCLGIIVSFIFAWLVILKFSKYMVYPSELMKDSFVHSLVIIPLYMILHITKNRYNGKENFLSAILNICKYNALGVLLLCFMLYNFELNSNFWSLFPSSVMYLFFIINTMLELLTKAVHGIKVQRMDSKILHENANLATKLGKTE